MKIQTRIRQFALAGAVAASLGVAGFASAGTLSPTGWANGYEVFNITFTGTPGSAFGVDAGIFTGTQNGLFPPPGDQPILFLCYELDQYFSFGGGPYTYTPTTVLPPAADLALSELFSDVGGLAAAVASSNNPDLSAAIQLAVWEIKYDTGNGPYNLGAGNFQVVVGNATPAAVSLAQSLLDNLAPKNPPFGAVWLQSPTTQDFVTDRPLPPDRVPEPSPLPLLGAGLAALGLMVYRRKGGTQV